MNSLATKIIIVLPSARCWVIPGIPKRVAAHKSALEELLGYREAKHGGVGGLLHDTSTSA